LSAKTWRLVSTDCNLARQILPTAPPQTSTTSWRRVVTAIASTASSLGARLFVGARVDERWSFEPVDGAGATFELTHAALGLDAAPVASAVATSIGPAEVHLWNGVSQRALALVADASGGPAASISAISAVCAALMIEGARSEHAEVWRGLTGEVGFACDAGMRVTAMPVGCRELLGLGPDAPVLGRQVSELVPGWHLKVLDPGESVRGYNAALGCAWTCAAVRADDGQSLWHIIRFRKPSSSSLLQEQQTQFLQALRHDVRSPLTALRGLVAVVLDEPDMPTEERQQLLELLRQEAERVVSFVEDYLVALSLRVSPRPPHPRSLDFMAILVQYFVELQGHARSRGIQLDTDLVEVFVESDQTLLQAFVRNFVGAFFRMADKGAEISVTLTPASLVVRGVGPGLFQQRLDRPYTTLARSTSSGKRTPGAALGLFLAKKIADAHSWPLHLTQVDGVLTATVEFGC